MLSPPASCLQPSACAATHGHRSAAPDPGLKRGKGERKRRKRKERKRRGKKKADRRWGGEAKAEGGRDGESWIEERKAEVLRTVGERERLEDNLERSWQR